MKFRKKAVTIEAMKFTGTEESVREIEAWADPSMRKFISYQKLTDMPGCRLLIETLEGRMAASPGDWIIRGVNGEFYPCKPDIFAKTYERVEET